MGETTKSVRVAGRAATRVAKNNGHLPTITEEPTKHPLRILVTEKFGRRIYRGEIKKYNEEQQ